MYVCMLYVWSKLVVVLFIHRVVFLPFEMCYLLHVQPRQSTDPPQYYTPTKSSTVASGSSSTSSKGDRQGQSQGQSTALYELVSLVVHSGKSPQTGHYIAFVKSKAGRYIVADNCPANYVVVVVVVVIMIAEVLVM